MGTNGVSFSTGSKNGWEYVKGVVNHPNIKSQIPSVIRVQLGGDFSSRVYSDSRGFEEDAEVSSDIGVNTELIFKYGSGSTFTTVSVDRNYYSKTYTRTLNTTVEPGSTYANWPIDAEIDIPASKIHTQDYKNAANSGKIIMKFRYRFNSSRQRPPDSAFGTDTPYDFLVGTVVFNQFRTILSYGKTIISHEGIYTSSYSGTSIEKEINLSDTWKWGRRPSRI